MIMNKNILFGIGIIAASLTGMSAAADLSNRAGKIFTADLAQRKQPKRFCRKS